MEQLLLLYGMPAAAAAALGMAVGLASPLGTNRRGRGLAGILGAVILGAGWIAALLRWPAGRAGLWLDTGVILATIYVAGCTIGCVISRRSALQRT